MDIFMPRYFRLPITDVRRTFTYRKKNRVVSCTALVRVYVVFDGKYTGDRDGSRRITEIRV